MRFKRLSPAFVLLASIGAGCSGPHLPPTNVPPSPNPAMQPFEQLVQAYVNKTQPYRKQAAQQQDAAPNQQTPGSTGAAVAVRGREQTLAEAVRTKVRPGAQQGELFTPTVQGPIKQAIASLFSSPKRALLVDELLEQNVGANAPVNAVAVNEQVKAPLAPPLLAEALPPLPKQLEYDFLGRTLILRDVDADLVVDYIPDALPVQPPEHAARPAAAPPQGAVPLALALPQLAGGTVFGAMGDNGSGDDAQMSVAKALTAYFATARRFRFVLMLGDNLYHDDYNGEFLLPYKTLLDSGVKFYATLGNHDRDLEQHFKPFNMQDRDRYSFDEGNARFVALNTNHPADPEQIKWLETTAFNGAGNKWRICFFHHPLYSSGQHAAESRDVIRPALENVLVRNKVNIVLSGHEHLYERIKPQQGGIRYFVSGGGGRYLYDVHKSAFDEIAVSEHHFMVAEIAGDAFLFEAVRPDGSLIDCGVDWRTDAASAKHDQAIDGWLSSCHASLVKTTQ